MAGTVASKHLSLFAMVAFALAIVSGVCAALSLLVDFATGAAGFYTDGWVLAFFITGALMLASFAASTFLGTRALSRRGSVPALIRSKAITALLELVALVALIVAGHFHQRGQTLPLLTDLLVAAFLYGLVTWNLTIMRVLRSNRNATPLH